MFIWSSIGDAHIQYTVHKETHKQIQVRRQEILTPGHRLGRWKCVPRIGRKECFTLRKSYINTGALKELPTRLLDYTVHNAI